MLNAHKTEPEGEKGKQDDDDEDEDEMVTLNDETAPSVQKQPFTIDAIMANVSFILALMVLVHKNYWYCLKLICRFCQELKNKDVLLID